MRPLRVVMEGFSTFRDPTEVDFTGVDLVALVGPTGSGKSSVIDAITFALYGSVARYDDTRLVAPVINQGSNEARVRLDFELGDRRYTAVRVVRRTKGERATTREARLEQVTGLDDDESPVLASGAKELTEAVEALLGLDFAQFTRTVVLPQGDFAEFLTDEPADRQKLLRRLLDLEVYARMGTRAREQAKSAGQRAEVLEAQLDRHRELTPSLVADQRRRLADLDALGTRVAEALEQVADVESRLVGMRAAVNELDGELARLAVIAPPADDDLGATALAESREVLAGARLALTDARSRRDRALQARAAAGDPAAIEARIGVLRRAQELSGEITRLQAEHQVAHRAAEEAAHLSVAARAAADTADQALGLARQGADAAVWTSSLRVGEPCPVCRQRVAALPDHDPSAELAVAVADAEAADQRQRQVRAASDEAASTLHRLGARLGDRRRELEAIGEDGSEQELASLEQRLDGVRLLVVQVTAAEAAVAQAERVVLGAERSVEQAEALEHERRRQFGLQRDQVAALGPPAPAGDSLLDDWRRLVAWANEAAVQRRHRRAAVAEEGRTLADRKAELLGNLAADARPLGLEADPVDLPRALARAQAACDAEIARLTERLAEMDEWRVQAAALRGEQRVGESLGRHLSAGGFEGWLLTEALEDLVERASVRLYELSNGQYTLAVHDRSFRIVDHRNAGEQRDVRTLSGGETFLASLALALALADSIRELAPLDAPRLGSMFLDEGFGTLDADTLDLVASTIEELSSSGRLVGIVTHIEALAERMPVRYQVSKGPRSSSVERVVA